MGELSLQGLRSDLTGIESLLTRGTFLLDDEERQGHLTKLRGIVRKLDSIRESLLTVGLLGGTGVGKSTLMNGLAGEVISATSHRRPHTERVLVYHHSDVELPPALEVDGATSRRFPHHVDAVRQIVLCDLPDFDSLIGEHRQVVLNFMQNLDLLVWVTSPEKYADELFYRFLKEAPKAKPNFYFVLNKADLFFRGREIAEGASDLERVVAGFKSHLVSNGIAFPTIYVISAAEANDTVSPWNQFPNLKEDLFRLRDVKEVTTIKSANIDVEVERFLDGFEKKMLNAGAMHQALKDFRAEIERERPEWIRTGEEAMTQWVENHVRAMAMSRLSNPHSLVGPSRAVAALIREWRRFASRGEETTLPVAAFPEESLAGFIGLQVERLRNRLGTLLLLRGLPPAMVEDAENLLDGGRTRDELVTRIRGFVELRMTAYAMVDSKGFRLFQGVTSLILVLLFLFALGGAGPWKDFLLTPSWADAVGMVAVIFFRLFSADGLAALVSYLLVQFLLGLRFYSLHTKVLRRRVQKFIEALQLELIHVWEETLDAFLARLGEMEKELEAQLNILSAVHRSRKRIES